MIANVIAVSGAIVAAFLAVLVTLRLARFEEENVVSARQASLECQVADAAEDLTVNADQLARSYPSIGSALKAVARSGYRTYPDFVEELVEVLRDGLNRLGLNVPNTLGEAGVDGIHEAHGSLQTHEPAEPHEAALRDVLLRATDPSRHGALSSTYRSLEHARASASRIMSASNKIGTLTRSGWWLLVVLVLGIEALIAEQQLVAYVLALGAMIGMVALVAHTVGLFNGRIRQFVSGLVIMLLCAGGWFAALSNPETGGSAMTMKNRAPGMTTDTTKRDPEQQPNTEEPRIDTIRDGGPNVVPD